MFIQIQTLNAKYSNNFSKLYAYEFDSIYEKSIVERYKSVFDINISLVLRHFPCFF